jgi:hypothetical protein
MPRIASTWQELQKKHGTDSPPERLEGNITHALILEDF